MISIKDVKGADLFKGLNLRQLQGLSKYFIKRVFKPGK